ncbi:MAG: HlyD family secretion protein [Chromatiales bacterium]
MLAIGVSSGVAMQFMAPRESHLLAAGTIEARNVHVGSKQGGRVMQVLVQEGDPVKTGQLLVIFDDAELQARVMQAQGKVELARAHLDKMRSGSRSEDIAEARAATDDEHGFRLAELAERRADLQRARADLVNAERSDQRARELRDKGTVSEQFLDDAEAKYKAGQAEVRRATHAVNAAEGRLQAAKAATARTEQGFRKEDVDAAHAELARSEGELKEAEARLAEHEVRSPAEAVVEVLDMRPGDLVPPGGIVARLLETDQLFVMVYVPETRLGEVRIGQRAGLKVDAYTDAVFSARVEQIRQQAEFLPRNVQTREERVHQVIGVKLRIEDPQHRLRAGVSAGVTFLQEVQP